MSNERIHERIRKLLALAADPSNTNEASAAAAAAQRLMFEHSISQEQLEIKAEDEELTLRELFHVNGKQMATWRRMLATGVAKANGTRSFRHGNNYMLFGTPAQTQTVIYIYNYLERAILALCDKEHNQGKGERTAFCHGATEVVCYRLWEAWKAQRQTASGAGLMVIDNKLARLESELEKRFNLHKAAMPAPRDADARERGQIAGKKINLDSGKALGQKREQLTQQRLMLGSGN